MEKEVLFDEYCVQCEYRNRSEYEEPCDTCLSKPYNQDSHKPLYFKKGYSKDGRKKSV